MENLLLNNNIKIIIILKIIMMQKQIILFPTIYYLKKGCSRVPGFILVLCSVGE